MATPEVTANAQQTLPTAAAGVTVTPSGTAWVNSAYVQLTASIGSAVTIIGVIVDAPNVADMEFELDVARGAATSEVVVATYIGVADALAGASRLIVHSNIPIDDIASGQRIAIRLRKAGTSVATWALKLVYYNSVSSTVGVTANESLAAPSGAAGVSLTPSGTAWLNSAYGELHASLTDIVCLGLAINYGAAAAVLEAEFDLAAGAATSEVVKGTTGATYQINQGLFHLFEFRVPISIPGTNRLACRMRKSGTDTGAWTAKLLYMSTSGFGASAIQYTSQPQKISPDAAALPTVAGSMTAWANSAYVQIIASTAAALVAVARTIDTAGSFAYETDTATGAATSEVVVTSEGDHRDSGSTALGTTPEYIPVDNIASGVRVSMRHRDANASADTAGLGLTYYEKAL